MPKAVALVLEVRTYDIDARTRRKVMLCNGLQPLCLSLTSHVAPSRPRLVASRQLPASLAIHVVAVEYASAVGPVLRGMAHDFVPFFGLITSILVSVPKQTLMIFSYQ